jgi:hypothetical protein
MRLEEAQPKIPWKRCSASASVSARPVADQRLMVGRHAAAEFGLKQATALSSRGDEFVSHLHPLDGEASALAAYDSHRDLLLQGGQHRA